MVLSPTMKKVLGDGVVEQHEIATLGDAITNGQTRASELKQLASPQFVDAIEAGVGDAIVRLGRDNGVAVRFSQPIEDMSGATQVLRGQAELARGASNHKGTVQTVQRALMALASRLQMPALGLPKYGADGDFGGECEAAVTAFQKAFTQTHQLEISGKVDQKTALAIESQLSRTAVPQLLVNELSAMAPSAKTILAACDFLLQHDGRRYGTQSDWRCRDPEHPQWSERQAERDASGSYCDVPMNGSGWKCNLALGTALYLAGFEPPRYPSGAYPIATELYRYTKAIQGRNARDNVELNLDTQIRDLQDLAPDERRAKLTALISQAKPGQLLIVDHGAGGGADGGHCRIVRDVSDWRDGAGTIRCFQASARAALDKDHDVSDFMGEKHIYLLTAVQPREA